MPKTSFTADISRTTDSRSMSYLVLLAVVLFWGVNWPIMKIGLEFIPPLTFGAIRMGIGSLTFFIVLAAMGKLKVLTLRDLRIVFSEGILHMAAPIGLMNVALLHVDAGKSAILSFTTTLWITPFASLVLHENPSAIKLIGLGLGAAGVAVLFNPAAMDWGSSDVVIGNLLLMLAALTWAVAILIARTHMWNLTPLQLVPWQLLLSTIILLIAAWLFEPGEVIRWSPELGGILLFNGVVASGFCFWGALIVAKNLPSIDASIGFLGVPVAGVLFSALLLGEPMTVSLVTGLVLIVGGIAFVNFAEARSAARERNRSDLDIKTGTALPADARNPGQRSDGIYGEE